MSRDHHAALSAAHSAIRSHRLLEIDGRSGHGPRDQVQLLTVTNAAATTTGRHRAGRGIESARDYGAHHVSDG